MTDDLRVLTVRAPWANAIFESGRRRKTVENRTGHGWRYRGGVAIHVGQAWAPAGLTDPRIVRNARDLYAGTLGLIIGVVDLVDVHAAAGCCRPWGEDRYTDASGVARSDVVHLTLENPTRLKSPIPHRGELGLRRLHEDVALRIMGQVW